MNQAASETAIDAEVPSKQEGILRRRLAKDRLVTRTVAISGFSVIFVILAIFFVIAAEVFPLFESADIDLANVVSSGMEQPLSMAAEEYLNVAYIANQKGIQFKALVGNRTWDPILLPELNNAEIVSASHPQSHMIVLGLSDGRALPVQLKFEMTFPDGIRQVNPSGEAQPPVELNSSGKPVALLAHHFIEGKLMIAGRTGPNQVTVVQRIRKKNMMGTWRIKESQYDFTLPNKGDITSLDVGHELEAVYAGTASGQVIRLGLPTDEMDQTVEVIGATPEKPVAITLLRFLKGGITLIVGDQEGRVLSSHVLRGENQRYHLDWVHQFQSHASPVRVAAISNRDKGFLTGDADGTIRYHYATSGKTEYTLDTQLKTPLANTVLAPKGDGILAIDQSGELKHWKVRNPHPGVTLKTLFGQVRYEGYEKEQYSWQSTGGTDEFEPKLSLTPLIYGTLKGTVYAMLFAIPLGLLGAFYASQFMHTSLMKVVKPAVEFMAALPSVVLGFFAALWLAPRVEELFPSLVIMPFVLIAVIFFLEYLFEHTDLRFQIQQRPGADFWVMMAIVIVGSLIALYLGEWIEAHFLKGDFRLWILDVAGLGYDQRNSVVVGMAMGFAVIPIIFTIAEDSLSSVPKLLSAGSLALGATRWQTAVRVVLPTASPGIFSAVMIGFGRAVGETMIVLMATGNTPIMSWDAFSGFRALSANIAVELPEAPEGGTLFRVLFLAALLLFMFTFAVNSIAEWIRLKLREKYRVL